MARFTLSIELKNGTDNDYALLHAELSKQSFKDAITKRKHAGPTSLKHEYIREGNISIQDVVYSVSSASAKTGKEYSYTITRDKAVKN